MSDKNFKCKLCHRSDYSLRCICPSCKGIDSYVELLPCVDPKPQDSSTMSDNKDKCMRVDCAAHIKDRKLKTNKCCKLYDDIVVQQTPHHVGPACLFFTATPTESITMERREKLEDTVKSSVKVADSLAECLDEKADLQAKIKQLEADLAKPSEWISVSDRLPEESFLNWVLVGRDESSGCPSVMQALFRDGEFVVISGLRGNFSVFENPTHWQPLPSPPDKE